VGGERSELTTGQLHLVQAIGFLATDKKDEATAAVDNARQCKEIASVLVKDTSAKTLHAALREMLHSAL
jgi:ribosomal protein L11